MRRIKLALQSALQPGETKSLFSLSLVFSLIYYTSQNLGRNAPTPTISKLISPLPICLFCVLFVSLQTLQRVILQGLALVCVSLPHCVVTNVIFALHSATGKHRNSLLLLVSLLHSLLWAKFTIRSLHLLPDSSLSVPQPSRSRTRIRKLRFEIKGT